MKLMGVFICAKKEFICAKKNVIIKIWFIFKWFLYVFVYQKITFLIKSDF